MGGTRWVVQLNLGKDDDAHRIAEACERLCQPCHLLRVIPFSETLPHVPNDMPTVFYGGTSWVHAVRRSGIWHPAAWFDDDGFAYGTMLDRYGSHALNHAAWRGTLGELVASLGDSSQDELIFVRPELDLKEFAGQVIRQGDMSEWVRLINGRGYTVTENTRVAATDPVGIAREWRCFMVKGRVSSASQYRAHHDLHVDAHVPLEVIGFAETMANLWSPVDAFVMDVGESNDELYVIENNCANSAGFYACDIERIVADLSRLAESMWVA